MTETPSAPSPESVALVKAARKWTAAYGYGETADNVARRIDAHVAERTAAKQRVIDGLMKAGRASSASWTNDYEALRAKADAMAGQFGELIGRLEIRYEPPEHFTAKARDALAAYRALSPVGEEK